MNQKQDLLGRRFGRLTVIGEAPSQRTTSGYRYACWVCRCACGRQKTVLASNLRSGETKSCGCWRRARMQDRNKRHGDWGSPEYQSWRAMLQRCYNPNAAGFDRYGGRGITVCARWRTSYPAFLADMGRRPSPAHSLDRINNGGNYRPGNCRWATPKEQRANQRERQLLRIANCHAWALGRKTSQGFRARRVVWGRTLAKAERRTSEEIMHAVIFITGPLKPRKVRP